MELVYLTEFFASYSLPTLIISLAVAIITLITDTLFSGKLSLSLKPYLPFALATASYLGYEMIFVYKAFAISTSGLYAGMLCGSTALIINGIIARIKKGKPLSVSQTVLLIEGIISGYVNSESLSEVAKSVERLISVDKENTSLNDIAGKLKENSSADLNDDEFLRLAKLIITAIFSKEKTK